jgi:glutamate dehydrogenase/leucine dehydrogenase
MPRSTQEMAPREVARRLRDTGSGRAWIVWDEAEQRPRASTPELDEFARWLGDDATDYRRHRAIFLEVGRRSGALFGAFIHSCTRGQGQGGLRHLSYPSFESFVRDGLRLSQGMARKSALAGLWWGGGKGVIAPADNEPLDRGARRALFAEYARFVTSLRGCYVTGEDAGTTQLDMAEVARHTRFATCVPPEIGGSGNPSAMTALGVVEAMEAALDHAGAGTLAGKKLAMQGAGQVGTSMLELLFEKGVEGVVLAEISQERCNALAEYFAGRPLELRHALPGDDSILGEPCDVLVPNALGGVLTPKTIRHVRASIVCGAANNQLKDDERDAELLCEAGIVFVPDYVANRMGIVVCCNEQAGSLPRDPAILAHLDRSNPGSVFRVTQRVLARAAERSESPMVAANALADDLIEEPHPIHGDRTQRIIDSLVEEGWAE